ncbi:MAG: DAK2 domain-containing protein [Oscillospiraceae bacterium]|nr:DAK2 domain-containing protein [Oscillospiraceae bacterium]
MINGNTFRNAVLSGANKLAAHKKEVDGLNVFPVPDGDTGTNMSMTIQNAAKDLKFYDRRASIGEIAKVTASAMLRGARGNSGVILSLLFRGIARRLKEVDEAGASDIAEALAEGVDAAYKAVMKPTEGTMLTVSRLASYKAKEAAQNGLDAVEVWRQAVDEANAALLTTPELLPVLKKAGVVDSGGQGLCYIFEGMLQVLEGGEACEAEEFPPVYQIKTDYVANRLINAAGHSQEDIKFAYCTEFIVIRQNLNDPLRLRAYLDSIGDSLVMVDDEEVIKIHVHTNDPGFAIQEALKYGYLTRMKIENMKEQHETKAQEAKESDADEFYQPVDPEVAYGFVAVAAGDGLKNMFESLGCNYVVSGGQTMNPSTDDILAAVHSVPARTVFVLPNNKNIIMTAEQTIHLADREVIVLPTATVPQGISAITAFDPQLETLENVLGMTGAFESVMTGQITYAARNSDFDGHKIKEGELLALEGNKLAFTDTEIKRAVLKLCRNLSLKSKGATMLTVYYGSDVTEAEAAELENLLNEKMGANYDIVFVNGGQPVYYYILSLE